MSALDIAFMSELPSVPKQQRLLSMSDNYGDYLQFGTAQEPSKCVGRLD